MSEDLTGPHQPGPVLSWPMQAAAVLALLLVAGGAVFVLMRIIPKLLAKRGSAPEREKAARKQARQAKNAQLKSLEQRGYGPSADPNQYPENLRNAEKNAGQPKQAPSAPASGS